MKATAVYFVIKAEGTPSRYVTFFLLMPTFFSPSSVYYVMSRQKITNSLNEKVQESSCSAVSLQKPFSMMKMTVAENEVVRFNRPNKMLREPTS